MLINRFKIILTTSLIGVVLFGLPAHSETESLDQFRARQIVQALNLKPQDWLEPIEISDVKIKNGSGRVDVNKKAKFSYYIQTENPNDPKSAVYLIPMATSRYTPTYYQTDEWWDAHVAEMKQAKLEGRPAPRQDFNEVAAWLKEMKLSTNPTVFKIENNKAEVIPLQTYLLNYFVDHYAKNGKITLYRGGEKVTETDEWLAGRKPRGVRYWTPTATYAWRYARKSPTFMEDLINGRAPLYVFELSVLDFKAMVQRKWQRLTLGTELPKSAHTNFDSSGIFADNIFSRSDYMGIGDMGVEFEVRSNSSGATDMTKYFKRVITVPELVQDRVDLLQKTKVRLIRQRPQQADLLTAAYDSRVEKTIQEGKILLALQNNLSREVISKLLDQRPQPPYELANALNGTDFISAVQQKMITLPSAPEKLNSDLKKLNILLGIKTMKSCPKVFTEGMADAK